ncbi:MAG: N-acetyltransferase [Enterobacteriaceae bacterium]|jgi:predicted GNAT family acetyltransferase|nr:N-acetyltransferase [Enterobacteriaceae bacterium]
MDIKILEDATHFYINDEDGEMIAEVEFVPTGEKLAIIDHTYVDDRLRGMKIGKQLVKKVVDKMRAEHRKIIPLCPFAKHEFDTTPEYQDIRA